MYKRILVPLDGSELAEKALPYAEKLAATLGAEVVILNVMMPSEDPDNPEHRAYISKIAAQTEQNIKKSPFLKHGEKVKVASAVIGTKGLRLHAGEHIVDYAEKENISLIIMATHGRTGIRRWALGSTADKVASHPGSCPLLLIRAGIAVPAEVRLSTILVPLDGSKQSESVLPHVEWLAPRLNAKVELLNVVEPLYHIYPSSEALGYYGGGGIIRVPYTSEEMAPSRQVATEYIKKVNESLAKQGISVSALVNIGTADEAIIKAEKDTGADLTVMSTYGHSGFGRFDHGSTADKVMHGGSTPLLIIRPKQ